MIDRTVLAQIEKGIRERAVTLITGARQVGKTTLCKVIVDTMNFSYVSLANTDEREMARNDPKLFLSHHRTPLIIDEVQYAPQLFDEIEGIIDKEKFEKGDNKGMYVLTGSQSYNMMNKVSQSMSGRITIVRMNPLSLSEIRGRKEVPFDPEPAKAIERSSEFTLNPKEYYSMLVRGMYPELYDNTEIDGHQFYSDYLETYLERDVYQLINLKDREIFVKFMRVVASLTGQQVVYSTVAKSVGVDIKTVKSWLSVLEAANIIHFVYSYSEYSAVKSMAKNPKMYFWDTGLACFLAKINDPDSLEASYLSGPISETFMVNEIMKSYLNNREPANFYYYRDYSNAEIDMILQRNGTISMIEFKSGMKYDASDVKAFGKLSKTKNRIGPSCILSLTEKPYPIKEGVYVLPISSI